MCILLSSTQARVVFGGSDLVVLEVRAKLEKTVSLSERNWTHVLNHPEMEDQISRVRETLVDPDEIRESERSSSVWLFYKLYAKTPVTRKFLLVVVKVLNGEGFIVTAFFTDKVKTGA